MIRFRLANTDDIAQIAPIEIAAAEAFRGLGMDAIADDDPIKETVLVQATEDQRLWVAVEFGTVRAYLLGEFLPGSLYIQQVTVDPSVARRGIGAMLIESVASDSRTRELGAMTLSTFSDVPWNAPYYERIGFAVLDEDTWPDGIAERIAAERDAGLHAWPRVVMKRDIVLPES